MNQLRQFIPISSAQRFYTAANAQAHKTTSLVEKVKVLRKRSAASILKCKEALNYSNGDIEKAIRWLRQTGSSYIQNSSANRLSYGLSGISLSPTKAVIGSFGCETDHAASTLFFQKFLEATLKACAESLDDAETIETEWKNCRLTNGIQICEGEEFVPSGMCLSEVLSLTTSVLDEPISVRSLKVIPLNDSINVVTVKYLHNGVSDSVGGAVALTSLKLEGIEEIKFLRPIFELIAKALAMQVICSPAKWLKTDDIPEEQRNIELLDAIQVLKKSGIKQSDVELERIAFNKVTKSFEEFVFETQEWKTFPYLLGQLHEFCQWLELSSNVKKTTKVQNGIKLLEKWIETHLCRNKVRIKLELVATCCIGQIPIILTAH